MLVVTPVACANG